MINMLKRIGDWLLSWVVIMPLITLGWVLWKYDRIYHRWLKWYYTKRGIPFVVVHDKFGNYVWRTDK